MKKHFITTILFTLFLCAFKNSNFAQTDGQYIVTVRLDNIRAERSGAGDGPLWGYVDVRFWQLNDFGQREKEIYPTAGTTKIWDKPNEGSAVRIDRNGGNSKGTVPNTTLDFWVPESEFDKNQIIIETRYQLFTSHKDNDFASTGYPKMPASQGKEMYTDCIKNTKLNGYLSCGQTLSYRSDSDRPYNFTVKLTAGILKVIPGQPKQTVAVSQPPTEQTPPPTTAQNTPPAQAEKTKEQRKADNIDTGVKIVGGIVDILKKRKEEKAKKQAEQEAQQGGNEPESVVQKSPTKKVEKGKKITMANTQTVPTNESPVSEAIKWQNTLLNNSTTNNASFDIKACVETAETIKGYILIQNSQRLSIPRGLIPRKANDCANAFNQTVTLKNGENSFQLIAQTGSMELKSAIFTTYFKPNAVNMAQTAPPQYSIKTTRRLALVIGNADYGGNNSLKNPINDATDIAAALREIGFDVMTATNTTRRKMDEIMDEFGSKLKNYDVVFFYYAGHGLQVGGENYLMPIDAKPQTEREVKYDCFEVGKLIAKMDIEDVPNRANIIVLDACRDNPLKRSWSRSTGGGGLANMSAPSGTFIGFATAPGSTAADGTGRNGVYTSALLQHIRKPNLSVFSLFTSVNGTVKATTNNQQVPWINSSLSEDLFLTR
jgi:hypothetical protein